MDAGLDSLAVVEVTHPTSGKVSARALISPLLCNLPEKHRYDLFSCALSESIKRTKTLKFVYRSADGRSMAGSYGYVSVSCG
eukprot:994561-Pyramimonas_sp.AAC.1